VEILDAAESRLAVALLLNGSVLWTCHRFLRWLSPVGDRLDHAIDLILWHAAVVTAVVGGLGCIGALSLTAVTTVVLVLAITTSVASARSRRSGNRDTPPDLAASSSRSSTTAHPWDHTASVVVAVFTVGFVIAIVVAWRTTPALATDALIYHLGVPAQWLQDQRLSLVPLWFHNPANTYSPLHASCVFAWWMLPMGNDVLARFGQLPMLLLCWLCIFRMLRRAGVASAVAAATAGACCLSRPFLAEAVQAKDDVILTGYVLAAIAALNREDVSSIRGTLRVGLAVGLLLATKYTAFLALPAIALSAAPVLGQRAIRRRLVWTLVPIAILAGPWYLRNLILTHNPVFPVEVRLGSWTLLAGAFATTVTSEQRTLGSLMDVLVGTGRFSIRWWLLAAATVAWATCWPICRGRWRESTVLTALLGPPLLLVVFYFVSPFREVRFLFPAIALLFVAAGLAIGRLPGSIWISRVLAGALLTGSVATAVPAKLLPPVLFVAAILSTGALIARFVWLRWIAAWRDMRLVSLAALGLFAAGLVYVYWAVYVDRCRTDYRVMWTMAYEQYGLGPAWEWLDKNAAPGDVIACTGTPMTYPLMGFDLDRRVVYVPVRPDIQDFADLPRIAEPLAGGKIIARTMQAYRSNPDKTHWLSGLARRRVRFVLTTPTGARQPIEQAWADADRGFRLVFRSDATRIYAVPATGSNRPSSPPTTSPL